ncbi:MAG: GNAT family N-acetyltransferase [Longimicrobiales bacterium]
MKPERYEAGRHRAGCLAVFDSNVGHAFRAEERPDFAGFLDHLPGPYHVLMEDEAVAACGGWATESDGSTASICWTMVEWERHGRGVGSLLHANILGDIARAGGTRAVRLETIPATAGYFRRFGFEVVEEDPDGYGPGLPRVEMRRMSDPR